MKEPLKKMVLFSCRKMDHKKEIRIMKNITRENAMKMYETRVEMWRKIRRQHDSLREKIEALFCWLI